MASENPERNRVIVTFARPEKLPPSARVSLLSLLCADERQRLDRLRAANRRDEYLLAHGLLRVCLSRSVRGAVPPAVWRFGRGPHGKPYAVGPAAAAAPALSLSHTPGLVACAVSFSEPIGIDLERLDRAPRLSRLSRRVLSKDETTHLAQLPAAERPARFLTLWTLKEAYVKARGEGLTLPVRQASFTMTQGQATVKFAASLDDSIDRWSFHVLHPTPTHVLGMAVPRGAPVELTEASDLYD